jgi:hypothetical protein
VNAPEEHKFVDPFRETEHEPQVGAVGCDLLARPE